jgi:hypothetical protein
MLLRIENVSEENCNKLGKCKFSSRLCIQILNEVPCSCRNLHHFLYKTFFLNCRRECSYFVCSVVEVTVFHPQLFLKGWGHQMNIFIAFYIKSGLSVHL